MVNTNKVKTDRVKSYGFYKGSVNSKSIKHIIKPTNNCLIVASMGDNVCAIEVANGGGLLGVGRQLIDKYNNNTNVGKLIHHGNIDDIIMGVCLDIPTTPCIRFNDYKEVNKYIVEHDYNYVYFYDRVTSKWSVLCEIRTEVNKPLSYFTVVKDLRYAICECDTILAGGRTISLSMKTILSE